MFHLPHTNSGIVNAKNAWNSPFDHPRGDSLLLLLLITVGSIPLILANYLPDFSSLIKNCANIESINPACFVR